jgi:RNA polymerase sigma factor (sigma-70 family)
VTGLDDSQLLERFVARHDEAAFAALVASHGPLVLGVCRRILRDEHEIEDAFQATFLVLVRRAGSIRDAGRLGPWLHGVARRVALRSRSEAASRRTHHRQAATALEHVAVRPAHSTDFDDVIGIIDKEIARLPGRYRDAVVLCDLEERSYTEAASRLRCPLGTVQSRLARGRARLRSRLIRRGLAPLAVESFLIEGGSAAVPDLLAEATVRTTIALAAGKVGVAGAVSVTAVALARSAMRSMSMAMMQRIAVAFAALSIAIGVGLAGNNARSDAPISVPAPGGVQPPPAAEPEPGRTVTLAVSSKADGSPLAGATVWVRATRGRVHTWEGTTDDQGQYVVVLPGEGTNQLDVVVAHPGYVPEFTVTGSPGRRVHRTIAALYRAETIGGTTRDERGLPIAGARVFTMHWEHPPPLWPEIFSSPNSNLAVATTDAQGRWRSDTLPANSGPEAPLKVLVTHPDHIATELRTTAEKARAFSIEQVMKTGIAVSGAVLSPLGRPVEGATVVVGMPLWEKMFLRFTTDKNGQFRSSRCFDSLQSKPTLTVQATGLAIAAQTITVKPDAPPLVIRLTRRRPIEGRVIDVHGRPVVGAAVLPSRSNFQGLLDWEADTDSNGRFVWYDAPSTGAILLDVSKPTFGPVWARAVDPAAGEVTITLRHPQHLHGSVTDSETGRPIERFTLIHGSGPSLAGARPAWNRDPQYTRTFSNGQFDLRGDFVLDEDGRHSVLIEADGYQPDDFVGFTGNVEDVAHDFKLRKATPFSGIVRSPDGRPLAGAEVALDDIGSSIHVGDGSLWRSEHQSPSLPAKTDLNGRYSLPSRDGRAWIVVVHKVGFALRSPEQLAGSTDITVAPWGRIEGVMKIEGLVAPSERVWARLNVAGFGGLVEHRTRTDQNGCFTFDRVAPGVLTVGRAVPEKVGGSQSLSNPVAVELAPGQTARVQIGGTGRPVIGRPDRPERP